MRMRVRASEMRMIPIKSMSIAAVAKIWLRGLVLSDGVLKSMS